MATKETRDRKSAQRFTKSEEDLQKQRAAAEGYASLYEWQRDVLLMAARGGDRVQSEMDRLAEEAGKGYLHLGEQISSGTAQQLQRGIDQMTTAARATIGDAVREGTSHQLQEGIDRMTFAAKETIHDAVKEGTRLAMAAMMKHIVDSQEAFRREIADNMQALLLTAMGVDANAAGGQTGDAAAPASADQDADLRSALSAAARHARSSGKQ